MNPGISLSTLIWMIGSLGVVLKALVRGQFSHKVLACQLLKQIHNKLTRIHSESNQLTFQDHRIIRGTSNAGETDDGKILRIKLRTLTIENDALNRRLRDNNPTIAELSDELSSNMIAKEFNQLCAHDWTEGFQVLCHMGKSDKESVHALFYILKQRMRSPSGSPGLYGKPRDTLNELRRQTCVMSKETVINAYLIQETGSSKDRNMLPFIKICLEISWYMVLHTPPVYMDECVHFTKGSHFNKDLFKPYSRQGTAIDFVVWPPLYLNKGGPLLEKGVAKSIA